LNPTVAPVPWRSGDFSGLGTPIIDPLSGQPFADNKISADRLNAVSLKIQDKFFPEPKAISPPPPASSANRNPGAHYTAAPGWRRLRRAGQRNSLEGKGGQSREHLLSR
jgi:hypothetical protein